MKRIFPLAYLGLLLFASCKGETDNITYPAEGGHYGPNLLALESGPHPKGDYSMHAMLEKKAHLKVTIKGVWFYESESTPRWYASEWDDAAQSRTFTSAETGELDGHILLEQDHILEVSIFENNSETPTFVKNITVVE